MSEISFLEPIQANIHRVEQCMRAQANGQHPEVGAALDHLLTSGGKRIRVAVTLLTGGMLGADPERVIMLASSIELLHTATLVHDDLIDGALMRRGTPTLNAQWSPAATVLTGDFIFARAASLAAQTESVEVMKLFAETLAIIVNGEIAQLFDRRGNVNLKNYEQRIYAKTASLFEAAVTSAALLSPGDNQEVQKIRQFGYGIGMAFQVVDDILDYTGEQTTVGKPVGSDLRQGLVTLPALYYLDQYPGDADLAAVLAAVVGNRSVDHGTVERLVRSIRSSGAIEKAQGTAQQYIYDNLHNLDTFGDCVEKDSLIQLADYILQRTK